MEEGTVGKRDARTVQSARQVWVERESKGSNSRVYNPLGDNWFQRMPRSVSRAIDGFRLRCVDIESCETLLGPGGDEPLILQDLGRDRRQKIHTLLAALE
jgi:hypothetical protein